MNLVDILLIILIAIIFLLALRKVIKNFRAKKYCSCSDGCSACGKKCKSGC